MTKILLQLLLNQQLSDSGAVCVTHLIEKGYRFKTHSLTQVY